MYVQRKYRGLGDAAGMPCLSGQGPLDIGQQRCASVDSVTVTASPGTGPLCLSGWMFPWLGRMEHDASVDNLRCVDVLTYNGYALPAIVPPLVTVGLGLLLARALLGGR